MAKIKKWFSSVKAEIKKVVWPKPDKLVKNTGVALAVMVVTSAVMFGFDQLGQGLLRLVLTLF